MEHSVACGNLHAVAVVAAAPPGIYAVYVVAVPVDAADDADAG